MSVFFLSPRVGKNGRIFSMLKFRTLRAGSSSSLFAATSSYTRFGWFLRKYKLDELPQLLNWLRGDLRLFGYRPEEPRTFSLLPPDVQEILKTQKPGIIDLASIHFFDEERILQLSADPHLAYWQKIRPIKLTLQFFYIQNKCWLLNLTILWLLLKKLLHRG